MKFTSATILLLVNLLGSSCSTTSPGFFSKKTPHEKYAENLDDQDLDKTPQGRQWLAAAKTALETPYAVQLPYRQVGYFQTDKPRALGLKFSANRGERLLFTLNKSAAPNLVVYADLFQQSGSDVKHLRSSDTEEAAFYLDIEETGSYLLRLQPELGRTGEYSLSIAVGPSIGFPVSGTKAEAGSFWGDSRDGGKRSHEGVDIFAPKGTPAVASADGIITSVNEESVGGKVVRLQPTGKDYYLYYAHLDKQLVKEGQTVKQGDVLGLVGNTGNAKRTPSHLHFGVYVKHGPIDPYPFINKEVRNLPTVPEKSLANYLRLTKSQRMSTQTIIANTVLVPLAVTANGYISESPEGTIFLTPFSAVRSTRQLVGGAIQTTAGNEGDQKRPRHQSRG
jgi:peptidoglycan LD-endopeptidase LytH